VTAYARWRACATSTPSTRHQDHLPSSAAGSSDPFAKFEVTGGDTTSKKPFKSQTKYKTLCPRWNELFQVPLKKGEVQPRLEVLLYDEDEVSSPDFMGRISIEISEFCSTQKAKREWFTLLPEEGKSDNVKGAVELIAQWWYNPALDFEPFLEEDTHADAPPNELRVAIVAARDLAIKDKNLLSRLRCLRHILRRLPPFARVLLLSRSRLTIAAMAFGWDLHHLHAIDAPSHWFICPQVEGRLLRPALHAHGVGHGAQGPVFHKTKNARAAVVRGVQLRVHAGVRQ
jgi:hypothetical protein